MSEIILTQKEADFLIKMEKIAINDQEFELPDLGGSIGVPLQSINKKEHFILDLSKGRIDIKRQTFQNRARESIVLIRLDLGKRHRNPDKVEIGDPHIHYYREGYGHKWAFDLPENVFSNLDCAWQVLQDFMKLCNITKSPNFKRSLFS
jgi:hypothetical protein